VRFRKMMIGDDQINTHAQSCLRRLESPDAGIHADDQLHPGSRGTLNDVVFDSISLFDPVGHMEISHATAEFDGCLQDYYSRGAIHIVVAINQDLLTVDNGSVQTFDGFAHAQHEIWRAKLRQGWSKKIACLFSSSNPSQNQKARHQRRKI